MGPYLNLSRGCDNNVLTKGVRGTRRNNNKDNDPREIIAVVARGPGTIGKSTPDNLEAIGELEINGC